jgi:hypothetical protein
VRKRLLGVQRSAQRMRRRKANSSLVLLRREDLVGGFGSGGGPIFGKLLLLRGLIKVRLLLVV